MNQKVSKQTNKSPKPVDVRLTEGNKTVVFLIHIEIFNKTFAKEVVKTPEQLYRTRQTNC